jgi:hypothetical protein
MLANCTHCQAPLDPDAPTTFRLYEAWGRKSATPSRRAGSDLVLRVPVEPAEFCCSTCIAQRKRNVAPLQGALV